MKFENLQLAIYKKYLEFKKIHKNKVFEDELNNLFDFQGKYINKHNFSSNFKLNTYKKNLFLVLTT